MSAMNHELTKQTRDQLAEAATFATMQAVIEFGDAELIEAVSEEIRWYASHPDATLEESLDAPFPSVPCNVLGRADEIYRALVGR